MSAGHLKRLIESRLGRHLLLEAKVLEAKADVHEDQIVVSAHHHLTVLAFCQADPDADLDLLVDETCIDHGLGMGQPRYEVLFRLRSSRLGYRLLLTVPVRGGDAALKSATAIYPAADWYEREIYDLFGLFFDGHPYLRRLLLYPGFEGHPGRRDYPPDKNQPLVALKKVGHAPVVIGAQPPAEGAKP